MENKRNLHTLIARNIGDLEAALVEINDMDDLLWSRLSDLVSEHSATCDWRIARNFDAEDNYFLPGEWVDAVNKVADEWIWLSFDVSTPQGKQDCSYLSIFTQSGPHGCSMEIAITTDKSVGKARRKSIFASNPDIIKRLGEHGFEYDPNEGIVFLPFRIDPDLLAKAFEDDNFDTALQPIALALDIIQVARPDLDRLVKAFRQ